MLNESVIGLINNDSINECQQQTECVKRSVYWSLQCRITYCRAVRLHKKVSIIISTQVRTLAIRQWATETVDVRKFIYVLYLFCYWQRRQNSKMSCSMSLPCRPLTACRVGGSRRRQPWPFCPQNRGFSLAAMRIIPQNLLKFYELSFRTFGPNGTNRQTPGRTDGQDNSVIRSPKATEYNHDASLISNSNQSFTYAIYFNFD